MFETVDIAAALLKAIALLAVLQASGIAIFVTLYRSLLSQSLERVQRIGVCAAIVGIVAVLLLQTLQAGRMAGEWDGLFDATLQTLNWMSTAAAASLVRVLGCILICVGLRCSRLLNLSGVAAITLSFLMTGHTVGHGASVLLSLALATHVLVAAFWLGALPALQVIVRSAISSASTTKTPNEIPTKIPNKILGDCATAFSAHAVIAVPLLAVAGLTMAWLLLPDFSALVTPYGLAVIAKITGFTLLLLLAALNKLRLVPAIQRGEAKAIATLRRSVQFEYLIIIAVLCATALMTTLLSPE